MPLYFLFIIRLISEAVKEVLYTSLDQFANQSAITPSFFIIVAILAATKESWAFLSLRVWRFVVVFIFLFSFAGCK